MQLRALMAKLEAALFVRAMSLNPALTRRLAGPALVVDGAELSAQTQLMLKLQRLARKRGAEAMPTIAQGRLALLQQAVLAGGRPDVGRVEERTVQGAEGVLKARLYVPHPLVGSKGPDPLLVFFHGGGMIYGDLDSHDAVCRFIAERAGVRVLAVDYRLAPEHPFPAGPDDAFAAYSWVVEHAADYGADPARLAVGGDSAGGYFAAATAIRAAEEGVPLAYQLLIYPVTDMTASSESREKFGKDLFLTTEFMDLAKDLFLGDHDPLDPRASVLFADLPDGLAPAYVATAGFDPLRDEGEAYAQKLDEAGVQVESKRFPNEIHGFVNILSVEGTPKRALGEMADALGRTLSAAQLS